MYTYGHNHSRSQSALQNWTLQIHPSLCKSAQRLHMHKMHIPYTCVKTPIKLSSAYRFQSHMWWQGDIREELQEQLEKYDFTSLMVLISCWYHSVCGTSRQACLQSL